MIILYSLLVIWWFFGGKYYYYDHFGDKYYKDPWWAYIVCLPFSITLYIIICVAHAITFILTKFKFGI